MSSRIDRIRKRDTELPVIKKVIKSELSKAGITTTKTIVNQTYVTGGGSSFVTSDTSIDQGQLSADAYSGSTLTFTTRAALEGSQGIKLDDDSTNNRISIRYEPINNPQFFLWM